MIIKAEKKGNLLTHLCFAIAVLIGCNTEVSNTQTLEGVSIELRKVLSNYPVQMVDTIAPLPEVAFILTFKNNSEEDYSLSFQDLMTGKDSNLSVEINCSNGESARLPLFQNTGQSSYLKKQGEITLSFKAKPKDILAELGKCTQGYLGQTIQRETENLTVVYKLEKLNFKSYCKRQDFESPEYFLME